MVAMFHSDVRTSRPTVAGELLGIPGYIDHAFERASTSWLTTLNASEAMNDPFTKGVIAYHDVFKTARFPAAWEIAYRLADDVIENANADDALWAAATLGEVQTTVDGLLASIGAMTDLGLCH